MSPQGASSLSVAGMASSRPAVLFCTGTRSLMRGRPRRTPPPVRGSRRHVPPQWACGDSAGGWGAALGAVCCASDVSSDDAPMPPRQSARALPAVSGCQAALKPPPCRRRQARSVALMFIPRPPSIPRPAGCTAERGVGMTCQTSEPLTPEVLFAGYVGDRVEALPLPCHLSCSWSASGRERPSWRSGRRLSDRCQFTSSPTRHPAKPTPHQTITCLLFGYATPDLQALAVLVM